MIEYKIGYYLAYSKFAVKRRRCSMWGCTTWKSVGEWVKTKEEAEQIIAKAKKLESEGIEILA